MGLAGRRRWRLDVDAREQRFVKCCPRPALLDPRVDVMQLDAQDRSLEQVEMRVVALLEDGQATVGIGHALPATLAVTCQEERFLSELLVAGRDHSAVSVRTENLVWRETEASDVTDATDWTTVDTRAEGQRSILDER